MRRFDFIFFLLFFMASFTWPENTVAQNYIDIDLNPPKKAPPKQPPPPSTAKPAQKPVTPKPAPAAKKAPSKSPTARPAKAVPQTKPALQTKKTPAKKPALPEKELTLDMPNPAPTVPRPAPTPPPPSIPEPAALPSEPPPAATEATQKVQIDNFDEEAKNFRNRHAFSVDYSTWYEIMKIKSKATNELVEGNSHYFGVAFSYDFTYYREKWGASVSVGGVTGNAQAGTKDSGDYYERRIPWTGFRGGGRLFWRANNRIELGLGFLAQSKSTKWPEEDGFLVVPQANPQYFYYLDTRWRINYRYELIQSFGAHLRSYALAWLLGVSYTL